MIIYKACDYVSKLYDATANLHDAISSTLAANTAYTQNERLLMYAHAEQQHMRRQQQITTHKQIMQLWFFSFLILLYVYAI